MELGFATLELQEENYAFVQKNCVYALPSSGNHVFEKDTSFI